MKLLLFWVVQANNENSQSLIPAYYALIAAGIGVISTLSAQLLSSILTNIREKRKLKIELIAEERSCAYLISQYYNVVIGEIVLAVFFTRLSALAFQANNQTENHKFHGLAGESLEKAQIMDEKIRIANANYFKILTHFTTLTGKKQPIVNLFNESKIPETLSSDDFSGISSIPELREAQKNEEKRLRDIYKSHSERFHKINSEMQKSI